MKELYLAGLEAAENRSALPYYVGLRDEMLADGVSSYGGGAQNEGVVHEFVGGVSLDTVPSNHKMQLRRMRTVDHDRLLQAPENLPEHLIIGEKRPPSGLEIARFARLSSTEVSIGSKTLRLFSEPLGRIHQLLVIGEVAGDSATSATISAPSVKRPRGVKGPLVDLNGSDPNSGLLSVEVGGMPLAHRQQRRVRSASSPILPEVSLSDRKVASHDAPLHLGMIAVATGQQERYEKIVNSVFDSSS
jgi:hypothetical protein